MVNCHGKNRALWCPGALAIFKSLPHQPYPVNPTSDSCLQDTLAEHELCWCNRKRERGHYRGITTGWWEKLKRTHQDWLHMGERSVRKSLFTFIRGNGWSSKHQLVPSLFPQECSLDSSSTVADFDNYKECLSQVNVSVVSGWFGWSLGAFVSFLETINSFFF